MVVGGEVIFLFWVLRKKQKEKGKEKKVGSWLLHNFRLRAWLPIVRASHLASGVSSHLAVKRADVWGLLRLQKASSKASRFGYPIHYAICQWFAVKKKSPCVQKKLGILKGAEKAEESSEKSKGLFSIGCNGLRHRHTDLAVSTLAVVHSRCIAPELIFLGKPHAKRVEIPNRRQPTCC